MVEETPVETEDGRLNEIVVQIFIALVRAFLAVFLNFDYFSGIDGTSEELDIKIAEANLPLVLTSQFGIAKFFSYHIKVACIF